MYGGSYLCELFHMIQDTSSNSDVCFQSSSGGGEELLRVALSRSG